MKKDHTTGAIHCINIYLSCEAILCDKKCVHDVQRIVDAAKKVLRKLALQLLFQERCKKFFLQWYFFFYFNNIEEKFCKVHPVFFVLLKPI